MKWILALMGWVIIGTSIGQDLIIPLWPGEIPNRKESSETEIREKNDILWIEKVQNPTLEVYLPAKRHGSGMAVVICPGGGYHGLAYDWEGTDIAKWLNSRGVAGIVLKYRLPTSESVAKPDQAPLQDAQRAIRLVRDRAAQWNIDPAWIGIMGFSAGGHLASTLGTHYGAPNHFEGGGIDSLSARPDFMVLIYPVVTFQPTYRHNGSKEALIGKTADQSMLDFYSNELQVSAQTPPTFLVHSTDDRAVPVENSILFYQALRASGVPAELHIYPTGGHGYSLGLKHAPVSSWPDLLIRWLQNLNPD